MDILHLGLGEGNPSCRMKTHMRKIIHSVAIPEAEKRPADAPKTKRPRGRPFKGDKSEYDGIHTGPHSGKVKFMIAIDEDLLRKIKILAISMGWSYSRLVERFCREGIKNIAPP